MNILILEDSEYRMEVFRDALRGHSIDHATTANDAIRFLSKGKYDMMFLDHDLGQEHVDCGDKNSGSKVAFWLAEQEKHRETTIVIHSVNQPAALGMVDHLDHAGFWSVRYVPYTILVNDLPGILG
jgi:CheY-like chemotaxis protein